MIKQIQIKGQVSENENGFYWLLRAEFPEVEKVIAIDSSNTGTYFRTLESANFALKAAGRDLAEQLAEILNDVVPDLNTHVVDPLELH
jgi:hypothetical protein